jgi:hypothetical protein
MGTPAQTLGLGDTCTTSLRLRTCRFATVEAATRVAGSALTWQQPPAWQCAKLLQVLFRQARKNRLVYLILAEYRLILPEAPGSAGRPRNHPLVIGLQRTTWKDRP